MMKKLILTSLLLAIQVFPALSHAALFDDTEARKKILEVESTMNTQNQATKNELTTLTKSQQAIELRLQAIEAIVKGQGLVDMQNQIETLKQEVARLKGELEVANHNVDTTQQRQKDLYGDTDTRLRKLEGSVRAATPATVPASTTTASATTSTTATVASAPQPEAPASASAPGTPVTATTPIPSKSTQEFQLLELANGLSKEGKYKDAYNTYDKFLKDYPKSTLAAEAKYGLGYAQFALKSYKSSIATQQKVLEMHSESPHVPEAMLNMANSQIQLGQVPNAKKTLHDLIAKFPNSEVTPIAQKRLKALEAIK